MNIARRLIILLLISVALVWASHLDWQILRMSDRSRVGFSQMMADAENATVVLVGESHNNRLHHALQLDVIRDLTQKKKPLAIGLEMFQMNNQQQLDQWVSGRLSEEEFLKVYSNNWSESWEQYQDIFWYARKHGIPMIALNIPMEIVIKVARKGFSSLTAEEKQHLPPEVTCELDTPYTEFLKKTYSEIESHALSNRSFVHFCEAQSLRNNGMAWNITHYLMENPARKMVVLTGILHAVKTGIPSQLSHYASVSSSVILPELPEFEAEEILKKEADYLIQ